VQVNYLLEFGRRSCIHVFEQPLDGWERRLLASVPVDRPAYMHSFGLTDRYVVLVESPLRVHPLRMRFSTNSRLLRYRLPRTGGTARVEEISPEPAELPRIHEGASAGRRYASLWTASTRSPESGFFNRINRIDVENGSRAATWEQDGCFAGEPLFIPRPGGSSEADGVVVSLILDSVAQRSALLALDAKSLAELARAELPHIVPFHFHGRHTSGAEPTDTAG
jgi:carotenoid cleavage dioxygenase-like enzyme